MKFLQTLVVFASLIFAPVYASDHVVLSAKNELGGTILLTFIDCPIEEMKGSKISIIIQPSIEEIYGCWFPHEETIYAAWIYQGRLHKTEYDSAIFKKENVL
jgi:hypothetical protein